MRKKLGFTQDELAEVLCMDVSCYCRRESGQIKISAAQWLKIAETLDVPVSEIYQSEDELTAALCRKDATDKLGVVEHYSMPDDVLGMYNKHVEKLELELNRLKELLKMAKRKNL